MATDEVLLESALAGMPSLRFYGWSEATVSLGYFQPEEARRTDPRLADLPFVRRPTGGAALVHHHELTYALALPPGPPWQAGKAQSWLCRMHQIIAHALANLGVSSSTVSCPEEQPFEGFLCFQHQTPGDLRIGSAKVAGSAQRRQRGALLQHGSLLLAASPHAPVLPGVKELSGRSIPIPEICLAIQSEFARQTGWNPCAGDWTTPEHQRINELVAEKYMSPAWNQKR
jgi:lipoate-protein ligase A